MAALVRLLEPLDLAAPAVRTAISRMVRQGWLHPLRLSVGPGYLLSAKAVRRLDDAAGRIYRTGRQPWDGTFDMIIADPPSDRGARTRLAADLAFLGYGRLDDTTWVAPRRSAEADMTLAEQNITYERFTATHSAGKGGATRLVRRAWDLTGTAREYQRFVAEMTPQLDAVDHRSSDRQAYAARFHLVHRWRAFLFRDPQLPEELLPDGWPGAVAAAFFDEQAARLRRAADRYVDACLEACIRPAHPMPALPPYPRRVSGAAPVASGMAVPTPGMAVPIPGTPSVPAAANHPVGRVPVPPGPPAGNRSHHATKRSTT